MQRRERRKGRRPRRCKPSRRKRCHSIWGENMMTIELTECRVHFPPDYDERGEWEVENKGWLHGVRVELPDGSIYPISRYDPVRLAQALESDAKWGAGVIAEPGLVVIPELTRAAILRVAAKLVQRGFFDHLKPLRVPSANGVLH